MLGYFEKLDKRIKEPNLEPVDVLMLTLDSAIYLERCLASVYKEIPVNKVIVADGGSKDNTLKILGNYPRMDIHVRPDIRTTGKCYEFMLSLVETSWIVFMDSDIELPNGWYDEMVEHKNEYDFFGCKRIMHYEFEREVPASIDMNARPLGAPWMANTESLKNYHVDDDYMWRATDILLRQVVEKDGYKFGKIASTFHYHYTTDNAMYESDDEKKGSRLVFEEPKMEILDQANWEKRMDDFRKAVVKYIDPDYIYPHDDLTLFQNLLELDPDWIRQTSSKWFELLQSKRSETKSIIRKLKRILVCTRVLIKSMNRDFIEYITGIKVIFH